MPRILKTLPGFRTIAGRCRAAVRFGRNRFGRNRRGNVSIVFAFSMIPLVGLLGLGLDYGVALSSKNKLDNAADAAALAAVATAKAYVAANPNDTNATANAVARGLDQASRTFTVNAGSLPYTIIPTPQITLTPSASNITYSSTVSYQTTTQNNFGRIFGTPTMTLSGSTSASADIPNYLDFYLLIDVSGSMGLPATASGMATLAASNNDMYYDYKQGCQFACHFPGSNGWNLAAGKIQLRSDAVNTAVCSLIQRASMPAVVSQYRIGLYPFINQMATLTAITNNMTTLSTAAQCSSSWPLAFTNLLDTGTTQLSTGGDPSTGTGSGGTHFEVVFPQIKTTITSFGDGSSIAKSRPFVFLITDGMENSQHFYTWQNNKYTYPGSPSSFAGYGNANWDGSNPSQIDPSTCAALKTAGATISILYIPYNIISFTNYGGTVAYENGKVNGFSPTLSTPLQQCASPGYFYTANSPADINTALGAMFNQAIQVAHLKQ